MIFVPYFYRTGFFSAGKQINTSLVVTFAQFSSLTALMVKKNHVWFCRKISLFFTNLTHIFLCFWLFFSQFCVEFLWAYFRKIGNWLGSKNPFMNHENDYEENWEKLLHESVLHGNFLNLITQPLTEPYKNPDWI